MVRPVITNPEALNALKLLIDGEGVKTLFAIPHYNGKTGVEALTEIRYLSECLESLANQSRPVLDPVTGDQARDPQTGEDLFEPETRFAVVVTNDCSPAYAGQDDETIGMRQRFLDVIAQYSDKIKIIAIEQNENGGIGNARNPVIVLADQLGIESVSFVDHDDTCDPRRVYATQEAFARPEVDIVYSAFRPMSPDGVELCPETDLEPGVSKYLLNILKNKPQGTDRWRDLFLVDDYYNLPSTTSVRTSLMVEHLFDRPLCEDNSRWPAIMAAGGELVFLSTQAGYRSLPGQSTASRDANGSFFDVAYVAADLEGMHRAVRVAEARGALTPEDKAIIFAAFIERSIAYNLAKPDGARDRPDIAAALQDVVSGDLPIEEALCQRGLLDRVNLHAESLGLPKTEMKPNVERELAMQERGHPVTYELIGGIHRASDTPLVQLARGNNPRGVQTVARALGD